MKDQQEEGLISCELHLVYAFEGVDFKLFCLGEFQRTSRVAYKTLRLPCGGLQSPLFKNEQPQSPSANTT